MTSQVAEWVLKAEGDYLTAGRELRARKSPNYDAVCFHAQQCAEKYLKAVLQAHEKHVPKIHNLIELMLLCEEIDSSFEMLRADLVMMERFSVRVRYPGETAEKEDAQLAYTATETTRKFIRLKLELK
jgi:HEPN domain-containing protein